MVIALGDHPQAQLCPAWQRQGQAPSHHLHTALEWGQCPPQRGWEKPLSRGHLLGDGGLSEPHEPPPSGQGGDTRQHSPGTGRGPAISTGESCPPCLLEAGEVSCCPVFDSVLVPCLLRVPPSPPPPPPSCAWVSMWQKPSLPMGPGAWLSPCPAGWLCLVTGTRRSPPPLNY